MSDPKFEADVVHLIAPIARSVLDAVIALDGDGIILEWNDLAASTFGWTRKEAVGRNMGELIVPPVHRNAHFAGMRRYQLTGEARVVNTRIEISAIDKVGREFPIELAIVDTTIADRPVFLGFLRDISDRRAAEEKLAQSEEALRQLNATLEARVEERTAELRLAEEQVMGERVELAIARRERERIFEMSLDLFGVATFDGYLKSINPAWSRRLGRSDEQLLAKPFSEIIHPEDLAVTADVVATLRSGQPVHQFHVRLLNANGESIAFAWSAVPDAVPGSGIFYTVGRDITEETAAAAELAKAQEALRQSQKMEAIGQLTGGIAHDFNNLLAGISGSLELLEGRIAQGRLTGAERYIDAAQGSARRAAALTQRLLAFSRRQTLDPRPTDVNRLIAGLDELIRRTIGPNVTLEVVGAGGIWSTKIDPSQLENALLNLCINARDAMPDGGRITIETANKWLDDRAARERELLPGQYVSVSVTDTGTGMTTDVIEKAFDPFFTTKPLGQGTGLGLSMVHGFVRQSGGQVRIYSEFGKGTTMCLYLPRFTETINDVDAPETLHAGDSGHGETVLVIDDEPTVRMLIVEVLQDAGYVTLEAEYGLAGLRILQSDARVDLLITDVGLPGGMNGRQVADAARMSRPGLKVLFVTGYAENAAVGNGFLEPGMQVITKPFAMIALGNKVREMIEGRMEDGRIFGTK
jgi:PAS domain S-box-containing protein